MKAGEMLINYSAISGAGSSLRPLFMKGSKYKITAQSETAVELLHRDGQTRCWFTKDEVFVPRAEQGGAA